MKSLFAMLLIGTVGLATAFGATDAEQKSIDSLKKLGADITVKSPPFGGVTRVAVILKKDLAGADPVQITDADLVHLKNTTNLRSLWFRDFQITDAGLVHLKEMTNLTSLMLRGPISDAGLVHLKGLTKLYSLILYNTQVTDAGLGQHLKGLTNLRLLALDGTQVTDAGVAELKKRLFRNGVSYINVVSKVRGRRR